MMKKRDKKENAQLKEKKKTGMLLIFLSQDNVKKGKAILDTFLPHERQITLQTPIPEL